MESRLGDDFFAGVAGLRTLRLRCPEIFFPVSLPQSLVRLERLRSLSLKCLDTPGLPEALGGLTLLEVLKLDWLPRVQELPRSLGLLTALRRLQISNCYSLGTMEFSENWTNLEVLQVSECPMLSFPGGALAVYQSLTSLHLGCSWLRPDPPELGDLGNLRVFRVSGRGYGQRTPGCWWDTVVPPSLSGLPSLAFIEARTSCLAEIPLCLTWLTSLEFLACVTRSSDHLLAVSPPPQPFRRYRGGSATPSTGP